MKAGEKRQSSPRLICRQTHKLRSGGRIRQEKLWVSALRLGLAEGRAGVQPIHTLRERADPGRTSAFWQESADEPGELSLLRNA